MPILPSQASPTMPSLLLPALVITSTCLFPAAHATLPLDDPALAEDLKAYIVSLDPTKPEDCIGFVNRHLSDILYTRFTHKSVLEDELARMKSTHATACLRNKTLKGISKEEILRLEAAERASPWWERSGWATRDKQSLLRLPPDAIKDAVPDADPALAANPQPIESASEPETHSASAGARSVRSASRGSCRILRSASGCRLVRLVRTSLLSVSALQLPSPFGRAPCKTFSRAGDVLLLDWNSHLFSSRLNINEKRKTAGIDGLETESSGLSRRRRVS